jgi:hypothetical protein
MLPHLDFADMPFTGLLATLFSGLEPAVAISLACVPFIRPLFGRKTEHSASRYGATNSEHPFSITMKSDNGRPFEELDDVSHIQLQPVEAAPGLSEPSRDDEESLFNMSIRSRSMAQTCLPGKAERKGSSPFGSNHEK